MFHHLNQLQQMQTEYCKSRIYPGSVPEFKMVQKENGAMVMQVRYRNDAMGYLGKWMDVQTEKENNGKLSTQT